MYVGIERQFKVLFIPRNVFIPPNRLSLFGLASVTLDLGPGYGWPQSTDISDHGQTQVQSANNVLASI